MEVYGNIKRVKKNNNIDITLNDDNISKTITLNDNRKIYTNKEYDITIIEIKKAKDKINNFMDLDEKIFNINSNKIYLNHSIYIPQYPNSDKAFVSYGIISKIDKKNNINHYCCTEDGSSGSPIINLLNNKIIGIHKEGSNRFQINYGTFLKDPIIEFINEYEINNEYYNNKNNNINNEIEIFLKINKLDINKKIYFLDNIDFIEDKTYIKHFHDNLKELNKNNTQLYINDKKYNFQKYFVPEKEGEYIIKLIFKINIKDCSFMFAVCKNITNINFKYFNTSNVFNMRYMFSGCENIKDLDLSSFDTKNVNNIEGMFGEYNSIINLDLSLFKNINELKETKTYLFGCKNLKNINLSSFDTKNVTNMFAMFCGCEELKELNLSSFNTKNVTNMMFMFCSSKELKELNLSSFNTKNVINMSMMFSACKKLKELNLSSFNTKNVTNMMGMFCSCKELKELNLSSFNTKNITNMSMMFSGCEELKELNLSSFDTKSVYNMESMFYGCGQLKELNLSSFDTKNVSNMSSMFYGCEELKELNLSSFDTKNVINMSAMFYGCKELKKLNLSSFDTKSVNNVKGIFYSCDINNFNLSSFSKFNIKEMISKP